MNLDEKTKSVVEMYSKYPFPFTGNHDDFFRRFTLPEISRIAREQPIRRVLEAGCGTGNMAADIATLLPDAEIVAIDVTDQSLALAAERAAQRGLRNLSFRKSNLLQHDPELGVFDFVHSQGVIHHLSDPLAGMKNLYRYLKPGHHAYVWLYMLLARKRILEMREALGILGVNSLSWEQKVQLAATARPLFLSQPLTFTRKLIKVLEYVDRNGFKGFAGYLRNQLTRSRQKHHIDIHLADQILHPQDKYYRFTEAVDMFTQAGFEFVKVLQGMSNTLTESFGTERVAGVDRKFSRMDAYRLIELHEQPEGAGYLIWKPKTASE